MPAKKPTTAAPAPIRATETSAATAADKAAFDLAVGTRPWLRRAKLALAANEPFCLWGPPGVGKTDLLYLAHKVLFPGLPMYVLVLSGRDPAEVHGLSVYDPETGTVRLGSWAWVDELVAAGGGSLYLDELSTATGATQAVALRILQERKVGERALPASVRIFASANPPDCAVDGESFRPPTANRMGHILVGRYSTDAEVKALSKDLARGYTEYLRGAMIDTAAEREAATLVAAYIDSSPESLFVYPVGDEAGQGYGWASPRSWRKYAAILATAIDAGERETALLMADDWLGASTGKTWRTYARNHDLPRPRALLDGTATFTFEPHRLDRARIVVASVVSEGLRGDLADGQTRADLVEAAYRIVLDAANAGCADAVKTETRALQQWRIHESGAPLASGAAEKAAFSKLGIVLNKAHGALR